MSKSPDLASGPGSALCQLWPAHASVSLKKWSSDVKLLWPIRGSEAGGPPALDDRSRDRRPWGSLVNLPATLSPQVLASGFDIRACAIFGQEALAQCLCVSDPRFLGAVAFDGQLAPCFASDSTFPGLASLGLSRQNDGCIMGWGCGP